MKRCKFCYEIIKNPERNQWFHKECKKIYTAEYIFNYQKQNKKRIQKIRARYFKKRYYTHPEFKQELKIKHRWNYRINNGGFYSMPEGIRANLIKKTMEKINEKTK